MIKLNEFALTLKYLMNIFSYFSRYNPSVD